MAHYAFLDENNLVIDVISGIDESESIDGKDPEIWYAEFRKQRCVRTSYNNSIRKNYAGIGYTYDESRDAFIPPKPFPSWTLNEETCRWDSPLPYPEDNNDYAWNEEAQSWDQID